MQKYDYLFYKIKILFVIIFLLYIALSCHSEKSDISGVEVVELNEFETIVSYEDNLLATPKILKYDGSSSLFVYDYGIGHVLELDTNGNIVSEIGQQGHGPGEFIYITNIILSENTIYLIDSPQFFIHKYDRKGEFHSSMDYGKLGYFFEFPPINPSLIQAPDPAFEPYVLSNGNVMLSPVQKNETNRMLYEIRDWDGNHLAEIGEIPEGSTFVMDQSEYRNSISNREVPSIEKPNAFPVNDLSNTDEFFLVYSAIPKIAKYNAFGEKLWESEVPQLSEIDSVAFNIYETMDRLSFGSKMKLNKYLAGTSTPDGDLYLATNSNPVSRSPLWIHRFNLEGELASRFKINSETEIPPIFDIDIEGRRIFVLTDKAEIRAYSF